MIRLAAATLIVSVALTLPAAAAGCMVRLAPSLSSDSDRVGPMVPCNARQAAEYARAHPPRQAVTRQPKQAKPVDPLKVIRTKMVAGKSVTYKQLRTLADSGDDLAAYNLGKRIEEGGTASEFDTALAYYAQAFEGGREFAIRPIVRLLEAGAAADSPKLLQRTEKILARHALEDTATRDKLIRMYRTGKPFGLAPEKADDLLAAAAEGGDGKAALDRAFALLAGTPDAARIEEAKTYLAIARASDEINVRTMAENLLRTLDPQLTAAAETTP